jgi:bifunctional DNA-binding transcriptional regulator/antitoxin component of YhaV-PrlF toxin-antitoxin module
MTIERAIRKQLGIKPRDIAVQRVEEGRLVVEFVRPQEPHMRSLAGILGPSPKQADEPLDVDTGTGRSIAEEWREYLAREIGEDR